MKFIPPSELQLCTLPMHRWGECFTVILWLSFALECWTSMVSNKMRAISVIEECCFARDALPNNIAQEIIFMSWWNIWKQWNDNILHNFRSSILYWKIQVMKDLMILGHLTKNRFLVIVVDAQSCYRKPRNQNTMTTTRTNQSQSRHDYGRSSTWYRNTWPS